MPFGSVPVASSHVLTSPTVASPSAILCRMASADDQNTADSGLPAASLLRMPGSDSSASGRRHGEQGKCHITPGEPAKRSARQVGHTIGFKVHASQRTPVHRKPPRDRPFRPESTSRAPAVIHRHVDDLEVMPGGRRA